jgi:hypothetical protein
MKKQLIGIAIMIVCMKAISISQIKKSGSDLFEHASAKYEHKDYQGA